MKKLLSLLSAAVIALSASAFTVTAAETQVEVTDRYEYFANENNLLWQDSGYAAYKKDYVYEGFTNMNVVIFKTALGVSIDDLSDLPEKYSISRMTLEHVHTGLCSDMVIKADSAEEIDEVSCIMEKWFKQGLITEANIYSSFDALNLVSPNTLRINVILKSNADIDGFLSDNQSLDFKVLDYLSEGYSSKYLSADEIKEIIDALRTDSRVESAKVFADMFMPMATHEHKTEPVSMSDGNIISGYFSDGNIYQLGDADMNSVIDLYDAIAVARFLLDPNSMTEVQQKSADINQDGKIDIYDAIGIAETLI